MSERESISFPSICSGDMYCTVPITVPAVVNGLLETAVAAAVNDGAALDPAVAFEDTLIALARPKSISLAPLAVSMMLPGFKSR